MARTADARAWGGGLLDGNAGPIRLLAVAPDEGEARLLDEHLGALRWAAFEVTRAPSLASVDPAAVRARRFDVALLFAAQSERAELARRFRSLGPDVPLVAVGREEGDEDAEDELAPGAVEFLARRHLTRPVLGRVIRAAVERSRLLRQVHALVLLNSDGVLVIDGDGVVLFANPAAERLFHRPAGALVGEVFGFPIETQARSEITILNGSEPGFAEMRVAEIDWEGRPAWLATLRDITDRKHAEELQARLLHADRLASVGHLAAGVAHEVNNPATFVMANLGFMGDSVEALEGLVASLRGRVVSDGRQEVPGEQLLARHDALAALGGLRAALRVSREGMERIVKIMRDLRTFSRVERDEVELLDPNDVVRVACNMTGNEIRHRARLVEDLQALPRIAGDRGKLAQVLTNLLVNAAQAIGEGAASSNVIRVSSRATASDVILSVEDTGAGIPAAMQQKIFEPFFTTKARDLGTGLGLSLSLEIVRRHGGALTCRSEPGQGSTFTVRLPIHGPLVAMLPRPAPDAAVQKPARRGRVLVVDDEPHIVNSFRRILARRHDLVTALGGEEALDVLQADRDFDLVICDLMMPDLDGVALVQRIEQRWPELVGRVVFCSGGAFTDRAKEFIAAGSYVVLDKPIPSDTLVDLVDRVVSAPTPAEGLRRLARGAERPGPSP